MSWRLFGASTFMSAIGCTYNIHLDGYNLMPALQSFKDFPPRQKPGSFSLDLVMDQLTESASNQPNGPGSVDFFMLTDP